MAPWHPHVVSVEGRFAAASNATLLGLTDKGERVVYKPVAGERPLWDFEMDTLAAREVLTYEVSEAMGLGVVPETALGDGIYGPGSVQRFIDEDEAFDPLGLVRTASPDLWPIAVLDLVCNNADRKLGHILRRGDGRLVAIDHGLTFQVDDKLRTVLWVFAGERLPAVLVTALRDVRAALDANLGNRVEELLGRAELLALRRRVRGLERRGVHPEPPDDRPPLPWPPY